MRNVYFAHVETKLSRDVDVQVQTQSVCIIDGHGVYHGVLCSPGSAVSDFVSDASIPPWRYQPAWAP